MLYLLVASTALAVFSFIMVYHCKSERRKPQQAKVGILGTPHTLTDKKKSHMRICTRRLREEIGVSRNNQAGFEV
jgi:hypothetical protein